MRQKYYVKYLFIITGIILTCIVGMQIYWLVSNYNTQKLKFKADIENALTDAGNKVQLEELMGENSEGLFKTLDMFQPYDAQNIKGISESEKNKREFIEQMMQGKNLPNKESIQDAARKMTDSLRKIGIIDGHKSFGDSAENPIISLLKLSQSLLNIDLAPYKKAFAAELKKKKINLPFELAIRNSEGKIFSCTTTPERFMSIPLKSYMDTTPGVVNLQAAFPDNTYVFKKMIGILLLTVFLIIVGTISFSYLIIIYIKQRRITAVRRDFVNNMTHELKTPITSVSVALEMIETNGKNLSEEKTTRYLSAARKEVARLEHIVENVLMIARLENHAVKMDISALEVKPWMDQIITNFTPYLDHHHAKLNVNIEPINLVIRVDEAHFKNLILNILENGLKYNDKSKPQVDIEFSLANNQVQITIKDNGVGIAPKEITKIFDKFYRVPQGDVHSTKGYGLGLSYVKDIVSLHGGSIKVESELEKGSNFIITIPA